MASLQDTEVLCMSHYEDSMASLVSDPNFAQLRVHFGRQ